MEKRKKTQVCLTSCFLLLLNNIFSRFFFFLVFPIQNHITEMFSFFFCFFLLLSLTIVLLRWNWKYFFYLIIYIPEACHHGILRNNEMLKGSRLFRYQIIYRKQRSFPFFFLFILNAIFSFFIISLLEDISSLFISFLMDLRHVVGRGSNEILFHLSFK